MEWSGRMINVTLPAWRGKHGAPFARVCETHVPDFVARARRRGMAVLNMGARVRGNQKPVAAWVAYATKGKPRSDTPAERAGIWRANEVCAGAYIGFFARSGAANHWFFWYVVSSSTLADGSKLARVYQTDNLEELRAIWDRCKDAPQSEVAA